MLLLQRHHYAAFDPPKPDRDDPATRREREAVRDRLLELHEMLWPSIRRERLDLHPHWKPENIVSMTHFVPHVVEHIEAMWLSYGKSREQIEFLKKNLGGPHFHGHDETENFDASYLHIRIQLFVNATVFRCWLAIHKKCIDRAHFIDRKLNDQSRRTRFWELVRPLFEAPGSDLSLSRSILTLDVP